MCGRATAELEMLRGAQERTVRENKAVRVGGGGRWRAKQGKKRGGTSKGSLLEKQKQITAKSHNKAPLSLLNTCSTEQPLCILGACSRSGRRALFLF